MDAGYMTWTGSMLCSEMVQLSQKDTMLSIWMQFHDFGQTIKLDTNGICDFIDESSSVSLSSLVHKRESAASPSQV
jgi:hypothetical protein